MRFSTPFLLTILSFFGYTLEAQTSLSFRVIDAEYSTALDRIVMVSEGPDQLHIYNPVTGGDTTVGLPKAPTAVSVGPDGLFAAVAFDSLVAYVNLTSGAVVGTYPMPGVVGEVLLAKDFMHVDLGNNGARSIQIAGGAVTQANSYYASAAARGRVHPSGKSIYGIYSNSWLKFDVSSGPVSTISNPTYSGDNTVCGGTWLSLDGSRAYSGCGGVVTLSDTSTKIDLAYKTVLAGIPTVGGVTESAVAARVAVLPTQAYYSSTVVDHEVHLFDRATLDRVGVLRLPEYVAGNRTFTAHGKWLFYDASGTALHVVTQADSTSGLLNDFSVMTYDFANPAPCVPVLTPGATVTVGWNGTTDSIAVAAGGACQYGAATSAPWLQVMQSTVKTGAGTVAYHVRANLTGAARSATITIGGQSITVTQAAAPASIPVTAQMSYKVVDAEFSAALDRVVLVSSGPNELHLFQPATWADQAVPLAKTPLSVAVRADGMYAAVGHDGWVSIVNLQTAQVESFFEVPGEAADILMDSSGYVYPLSSRNNSRMLGLEAATGKVLVTDNYSSPRTGRLHPGGVYVYGAEYSLNKWALNAGTMTPISLQNSNSACGNLWFSQDGLRVFSRCGTVFRSSSTPSQDLLSNGSLSGVTGGLQVEWVDHSAARGMSAVVTSVPYYYSQQPGLQLYGDEFLGLSSTRTFPRVRIGSADFQTTGRYVFWGNAAGRLYVFTRFDTSYGTLVPNDTFVTLVEPNIGTGGCTLTASGPSSAQAAAGDSGTVSVTSGDTCNWTAASSAAWLRITAGTFGLGPGSVLYSVDKNPYGLARTATLAIGGQTVTVTQAAGAAVTAPTFVGANPANPSQAATAVGFTVRDLDGAANVSRVYFQIGTNSVVSTNGCHGFWDRGAGAFFLYNDGLTTALGPVVPGSSGVIENGQCKLSGASSTVVSGGTDLALTLGMELKGSYLTGARNVYLWTVDAQGNGTGWVQTGTWMVAPMTNLAPTVVAGGATLTGASQTVTMRAQDGNGNVDISRMYFVVNTAAAVPTGSCHGFYDRATNALYLYNDALTALLGPLTPGATGTLQNSQCAIDGTGTAVTLPTSTDLVVTMAMRMQGSYSTGTRNVYVWAQDKQVNNTGWVQTATWTMTAANVAPVVVSGVPTAVTALTQTLTFTVRDGDGYGNLSRVYFVINPTIAIPANTCHGFYERANNSFYLYGDGLTVLGGPVVAGAPGTLQNGQCQISAGSSPVTGNGTDLTMNLTVTVRGTFAGTALKVALWAVDAQGNGTGWVQTGTWSAGVTGGPVAPTLASVSPLAATAVSQAFTVTARDVNGHADVARIYFQLHTATAVAVNTCHGFYDRAQDAVFLYNDALTGLLGPLAPGAAGSISNSQCQINGGAMTTMGSGNDFVLTLPMTLKGSYLTGTRNLVFWVVDQASLGTNWQTGAAWRSGASQAPTVSSYGYYGWTGPVQPLQMAAQDLNGVADLNRIYFVLNSTASVPVNSCHGFYDRAAGAIYLYNDALTGLVAGAARPGVNSTVANSQCSINGAASTVSLSGTDLQLTVTVTRLGTFATKTQNLYWWVTDNGGLGTGWVQGGTWAP